MSRLARVPGIAAVAMMVAFSGSSSLRAAGVAPVLAAVPHQQTPQPATQAPATQVTPNRPPSGPPGSGGSPWDWWSDPAVKKDLKLTEDQVHKIRDIFEKRETEVKPLWDMLNREGDRLDRMTRERVADESTYAVQVSKVQHLFARVRESRTVMIYRMYRELQPEQYKKLQEIMDRRRAMDGRGSGPR